MSRRPNRVGTAIAAGLASVVPGVAALAIE
mgnify:CR=1 FL=1